MKDGMGFGETPKKAPGMGSLPPPKMTMNIFASPATLTRSDEKKTGPSRFTRLFSQRDGGPNGEAMGWFEANYA